MPTRADLEAIIARGGAVSFRGVVITRIADLPSDVELTAPPTHTMQARAHLDAQIAALEAERAALAAEQPTVTGKATKGKA